MSKNIKLYGLLKSIDRKSKNWIKEFCFDIWDLLYFNSLFIEQDWPIKWELERLWLLNSLKLIYISKWDLIDLISLENTWLLKKEIIKILEEWIWKDNLYKEVEFFPVNLISETNLEIIKWYYVMHVINSFDNYDILAHNTSSLIIDYNFVRKKWRWWRILFSEKVKNILKSCDIGFYYIDIVYEVH